MKMKPEESEIIKQGRRRLTPGKMATGTTQVRFKFIAINSHSKPRTPANPAVPLNHIG